MTERIRRIRSRALVAAGTIVAAVVLALAEAPAASAHVTVSSSSAEPGGYAVLTFRVPTESETASTVGLTVSLPEDTPFTSVLTEPIAGWEATATESELDTPVEDAHGNTISTAVTSVTWTATGDGLSPGEFGEFRISVGPLPDGGTIHLPAVQAYSDGTTVEWVQQAEGSAEPEHPAPSIEIAAPDDETVNARTATAAPDGTAVTLGIAGLVVALVAAAIAVLGLVRGRR